MYAMIDISGDQVKAVTGSRIVVNNLNKEVGEVIENDRVMLVSDGEGDVVVGKPYVENAKVKLEVVSNYLGKKVLVFKKRRRKSSKVKRGFRQSFTELKVVEIIK